ncbi:MAG: hypothetical protein ACI4HQ_08460 [Acetatifactor sp.]
MKKIRHIFGCLTVGILLLFLLLPAASVRAKEEEKFFTNLGAEDEFLVCIEWENSQPIVKFKSPSGKLYDPYTEEEGTRSSVSGTTCYYYIEGAEKGKWNVIYDKLDNESIYITLESATSPFIVEDVTVSNVTGSSAEVGFAVSYSADRRVNYQISVSATEDSAGRVVAGGSCNTNERCETTVDLSEVSSYGEYRVYVYAWFVKDGVDIFDGKYSAPFRYTNQNQTELTTNAMVEIRPEEMMARISWEPKYGYVYLVSLFENGADQPSSFSEIQDTSVKSYDLAYSPDARTIEVRIAEKRNNKNYSDEKCFVCELDRLPEVTFDPSPATNRGYIGFHYKGFPADNKVEIAVNGESRQINLSALEEGDIEVEIKEDINLVTLTYYEKDDITVVYEKEIYYNRIPPRIYMMSDYTEVTTSSGEFKLLGMVTGADRLLVAGEETEIAADGSFSKTVTLSEGENIIMVEALDGLGNGAVYTARITYVPAVGGDLEKDMEKDGKVEDAGSDGGSRLMAWLPGILSLIAGLVLIILVAVLPKKERKDSVIGKLQKIVIALFACNLVCEIFFFVKWFPMQKQNHSLAFVETAYESISDAALLLEAEEQWKNRMVYGGICLAVWILAFVILRVTAVFIKKKRAKKTEENEKNEFPKNS